MNENNIHIGCFYAVKRLLSGRLSSRRGDENWNGCPNRYQTLLGGNDDHSPCLGFSCCHAKKTTFCLFRSLRKSAGTSLLGKVG